MTVRFRFGKHVAFAALVAFAAILLACASAPAASVGSSILFGAETPATVDPGNVETSQASWQYPRGC